MDSSISILGVKSLIYYFNKLMRWAIRGLNIDTASLNNVKSLLEQGKKVILMPIYKSFADFFIYAYINNHFNVEMPFVFGNIEDVPNIKFFEKWLK
jgi:hypothetical protein